MNSKEIKNVNEVCNLGVDFDDTFKADNHILSLVSRANIMIDWMVRNFISRDRCWTPVLRHVSWSLILRLEGTQRRVTKLIKKVKDYS